MESQLNKFFSLYPENPLLLSRAEAKQLVKELEAYPAITYHMKGTGDSDLVDVTLTVDLGRYLGERLFS